MGTGVSALSSHCTTVLSISFLLARAKWVLYGTARFPISFSLHTDSLLTFYGSLTLSLERHLSAMILDRRNGTVLKDENQRARPCLVFNCRNMCIVHLWYEELISRI